MKILEKITLLIDKILFTVVSLIFITMILMTLFQVILRYLFSSPMGFVDEATGFCLVWITLLGGAWIYRKNGHIGMDILIQKAKSKKTSLSLKTLINCISLFFSIVVLIVGGTNLSFAVKSQLSPSLGISMMYIYSVLPISGILFSYYCFVNIFQDYLTYNEISKGNIDDENNKEILW